jgi:hypothetical protein
MNMNETTVELRARLDAMHASIREKLDMRIAQMFAEMDLLEDEHGLLPWQSSRDPLDDEIREMNRLSEKLMAAEAEEGTNRQRQQVIRLAAVTPYRSFGA